MELNFTYHNDNFGFDGFEGTGLELLEYSLDAKKRIILTKLGIVLSLGVIALCWVFFISLIFLLVVVVLACMLFI